MKNIHIIPTDKPSRLFDFMTALVLLKKASPNDSGTNQNIYITSDEEIKEGWILVNGFILRQVDYIDGYMVIDTTGGKHHNSVCEKIILTTDLDLIKDGVQGIPDDFLEWFVKNPSCESVETKLVEFEVDMGLGDSCIEYGSYYEIIIPKEEPKQELERGITITHVGKQETLEEAAAKYVENELQDRGTFDDKVICSIDFIAGANWQEERMYSEEEVFNLCRDFAIFVQQKRPSYKNQLEWFEQFKKK
jgi:hypothetical protein